MPSYPRSQIVAAGKVGLYHCVARCVRRAFLCGHDAASGKSFEHRKDWVESPLAGLEKAGNQTPTLLTPRPKPDTHVSCP